MNKMMQLFGFTLAAAIAIIVLKSGNDEPSVGKPVFFKFTITVIDDGVEKSASTIVEFGEKTSYNVLNPTERRGWTTYAYHKGTAAVLDLGPKGWVVVPLVRFTISDSAPFGLSGIEGQTIDPRPNQAGGITNALAYSVPKNSKRPMGSVIDYAHLPDNFVLRRETYPRLVYFRPEAVGLWEGVPFLTTELQSVISQVLASSGSISFVEMSVQRSKGPAKARIDTAPSWLLGSRIYESTPVRSAKNGDHRPNAYDYWDVNRPGFAGGFNS